MKLAKLLISVATMVIVGLFGNVLDNPGFETGDLTSWDADCNTWQGWGSESHITVIDSSGAHGGNYYLEMGVGEGGGAEGFAVVIQETEVLEGQQWTFSSYIKDVGAPLAGGDFAALKYEIYDADGNQLEAAEVLQSGVTADWQQFSLDFTIPTGGVTAKTILVATRWDGGIEAVYGYDDVECNSLTTEDPSIHEDVYMVFETFDALDETWYEDGEGGLNLSLDENDFVQGAGAIDVEYYIPDLHGWGSFIAMQTMYPEDGEPWDFSPAETFSFWLKVEEAPVRPDTVFFRVQLSDLPAGANDFEVYAWESATAIDSVSDWVEVQIPLLELPTDGSTLPSDSGFTRLPNNWGQPTNDLVLNFDAIRSVEFDFVTSGWDAEGNLPADSGKVSFDYVTLKGYRGEDVAYFNGIATTTTVTNIFGWGASTLELVEGIGYEEGLNALKWIMGDEWSNGWSGAGFYLNPINYLPRWDSDSLKFHMNTPADLDDLKFEFQGNGGKCYYVLTPEVAGGWNYYTIPLADFIIDDSAPNFDTSAVDLLGFMANGNAVVGTEVLIGSMVTGNPEVDVLAPNVPEGVLGSAQTYHTFVQWQDVPGESDEVYNVYASLDPITDLEAEGVEILAIGVLEDVQIVVHYIFAPLADSEVSYYYAVECVDASGNVSEAGLSDMVTNTARGIPTISLTPPTVTIDGDLTEWYTSGIMPFELGPTSSSYGSSNVTYGSFDGDNDAYATFFLAVDDEYLYVAGDIIDDQYEGWSGTGNWWEHDVLELFIGLYDQRGEKHESFESGSEPDYKLVFSENKFFAENEYEMANDGVSYYFEGFSSFYTFEAMISLDSLAGNDDDLFVALNGMRTPIEPTIHDRDNGTWEGNVALSPTNDDNAWQTPSVWSSTWVGDQFMVGIDEETMGIIFHYSLDNNYPNPFNPTTTINYSLASSGKVNISVYNILGQEVATLVNKYQHAGEHRVVWTGQSLSSGVYIYRLRSNDFVQTKKMMLMK